MGGMGVVQVLVWFRRIKVAWLPRTECGHDSRDDNHREESLHPNLEAERLLLHILALTPCDWTGAKPDSILSERQITAWQS